MLRGKCCRPHESASHLSPPLPCTRQVAAEARDAIGLAADAYFQASAFLRLPRGPGGCVPAAALHRYCAARSAQIQLVRWLVSACREPQPGPAGADCLPVSPQTPCPRGSPCLPRTQSLELGALDSAGSGVLTAQQLGAWLERRAPLAACTELLLPERDWGTAVLARLTLLHARRGRLPLRDLLASPEAQQLAAALQAWQAAEDAAAGGGGGGQLAVLAPLAGWVQPATVAALRMRFDQLDGDGDGLLTQADFSR